MRTPLGPRRPSNPGSLSLHEGRLLSLNLWDQGTDREIMQIAQAIEAQLHARQGETWAFLGVTSHSLGKQSHRVAEYSVGECRFVLVPGGNAHLGWDGAPLRLSADAQRDWESRNAGRYPSPEAAVRPRLSPARYRRIAPLLVEATPLFAAEILAPLSPEAGEFPVLPDALAAQGFRLPTLDEWEWANRGGEAGYFRWGDEVPPGVPGSSSVPFSLHRAPNAFGLEYSANGVCCELVGNFDGFVGGDGGSAGQLNRPRLECWTPLAPAFRLPSAEVGSVRDSFMDLALVRRVLPLQPLLLEEPGVGGAESSIGGGH